ncbi:MAG TPA: SMC family ATPase, partial [Acidimicrobiia bacterium]
MRPVRIEVEGFSAYREMVDVDFEGVDFFSLAGPTGSGKSSLIDAVIFALYGRVPRLGGNAVAPAISAGADRARVRLDFEVGGTVYTAARLATRTPSGGATVKEARLQEGDRVIADGADNVTVAVEDLLRLRFDDFTRTVVLPQGDFARFLTATKSERQGLLRNLLGLDVYTTMRELARTRGAVAADRAESALRALETLDIPDDETAATAVERRDSLESLAGSITEQEKKLAALDHEVIASRSDAERIAGAVERLDSISPPDRLEELDSLTVAAREEMADADEAVEAAKKATIQLEASIGELPTSEQLGSWARLRERLSQLDERLNDEPMADARQSLDAKLVQLDEAKTGLETARDDLASARQEHAAHTLAGALVMGKPCPVCAQVVAEPPETRDLPEVVDLEREVMRSSERLSSLQDEVDAARAAVTTLETARTEVEKQRDSLLADLADVPSTEEAETLAEELARLHEELAQARESRALHEKEAKAARTRVEDLAEASRRIGRRLTESQLAVADLEPPLSESDDVIVQWKELLAWRADQLEQLRPRLEAAREGIEKAESLAEVARKELAGVLESHDIPVVEPFAVQVATALQAARSTVEAHEKALADSVELTGKAKLAET